MQNKGRKGALLNKHFELVRETEDIAKSYGFRIVPEDGRMVLFAVKGVPLALYGRRHPIVSFSTVEDLRSWMLGWAFLEDAILRKTTISIDSFKDLIKERTVLDKLRGEDEHDRTE